MRGGHIGVQGTVHPRHGYSVFVLARSTCKSPFTPPAHWLNPPTVPTEARVAVMGPRKAEILAVAAAVTIAAVALHPPPLQPAIVDSIVISA